jgi:hypothetical protein
MRMFNRRLGLERGRALGARVQATLLADRQYQFDYYRPIYPECAAMDFGAAVLAYDRERLACQPDYNEFPELRGHEDYQQGLRDGFIEGSGLDAAAAAYHFSWGFFTTRRLNARHVARWDLRLPTDKCTNVFFPEGREGVTISDNRDQSLDPYLAKIIPQFRPEALLKSTEISIYQGAASSALLLDEEPKCSFPCDPFALLPPSCYENIDELLAFLYRYREFWGPGNRLFVDQHLRGAAVEKSNCRMAWRKAGVAGSVAITSCSYLDPEMNAFKKGRTRAAMARIGDTEATSPDWQFYEGCDHRHRRLLALTEAEARRGATLWGALAIVADHAVPCPERICKAGERAMPERQPAGVWSMTQHAAVLSGPARRCLYRSIQDISQPRPVYDYTPKLMLGPGVAMQAAWQDDVAAGRCTLAPPVTA